MDYSVGNTGLASPCYKGVFCTGLAFLFYSFGPRYVRATAYSLILLMEIVFGFPFALFLLQETPIPAVGARRS
ncbi:MAG: EamA family transporter [Methanomassiliicoccales archaeon]